MSGEIFNFQTCMTWTPTAMKMGWGLRGGTCNGETEATQTGKAVVLVGGSTPNFKTVRLAL